MEFCTKDTNGCVASVTAEDCERFAKSSSTSATWNRVLEPEANKSGPGRDNYPKDCFLNYNNQIYFNPHATGADRPNTTPICNICKTGKSSESN